MGVRKSDRLTVRKTPAETCILNMRELLALVTASYAIKDLKIYDALRRSWFDFVENDTGDLKIKLHTPQDKYGRRALKILMEFYSSILGQFQILIQTQKYNKKGT